MVYAVTILVNAKNEGQVEDYIHKVFGPIWSEINEFPYGVDEDDLAADLESEDNDEE